MKAKWCVVAIAALAIWGLKRHYSDARPDDLWWILTPTARLVGATTGATFTAVPSEGYVSHERLFVIEKSCAGINFLAAAFGMLVFGLFHRIRSGLSAACVVGTALLTSYVAAVLVNTARITVAMWLTDHRGAISAISAADIHRLEGIVVYFGGLVLLYEAVRRLDRGAYPVRSCS